ncbi:hypothetical protein [Mycolicibacter minnesotensis]
MSSTDEVLRAAVMQWITEWPADEREAFIDELSKSHKKSSGLARGRARYRNKDNPTP